MQLFDYMYLACSLNTQVFLVGCADFAPPVATAAQVAKSIEQQLADELDAKINYPDKSDTAIEYPIRRMRDAKQSRSYRSQSVDAGPHSPERRDARFFGSFRGPESPAGSFRNAPAPSMSGRNFAAPVQQPASAAPTALTRDSLQGVLRQLSNQPTGYIQRIGGLPNVGIRMIAAGDSFVLVLTSQGEVYGVGSNYDGQLGLGVRDPAADADPKGRLHTVPHVGTAQSKESSASGPVPDTVLWPPVAAIVPLRTAAVIRPLAVQNVRVTRVACGAGHSLFLSEPGDLFSCGRYVPSNPRPGSTCCRSVAEPCVRSRGYC